MTFVFRFCITAFLRSDANQYSRQSFFGKLNNKLDAWEKLIMGVAPGTAVVQVVGGAVAFCSLEKDRLPFAAYVGRWSLLQLM